MGRPPKHYSDVELAALRDRRNELRRTQYRTDGGKRKAENQIWKDEHREQVREASRLYQRRRREINRELDNEQKRSWRAKNKDKVREYNRRARSGKFGREYNTVWQAENRKKNPIVYSLRNCKNRAARLGVKFDLEIDDIVIPKLCPVLGIPLVWGNGKKSGFHAPNTPSLDRRDPRKGYVRGNVFVMSNRANILKRDGTLDEFRKIVAYMERVGAT